MKRGDMDISLAVLIVEDSESDARLIVRLFKKAGYEVVFERVETVEQMRAALGKRTWNLVISNYQMPKFDGYAALQLLKDTGCDIPFIIISDTIDEEKVISIMKAGAQDYLIKGDLARLVSAVGRELNQSEVRRERKRAEEALRESENRYRALVDISPDSIGIHCDGKVVYVNAAAANLFHANSIDDLIGMPVIQFIHPDYQTIAMERVRRSYENHQSASLLKEKFITLDGQPIDVEVTTTPIMYDGKTATQVIIRDITKRMQAEEALGASEAKLRALVEQVPAIVYTESAETRETLYISPQVEKLTGYTPGEWMKDPNLWEKITHPEDLSALLAEDERTTTNREPFYIEYRILTRDGRTLWIHDEAVMIQSQDGTPLFWQGVMYDITERKQAEKALQKSERFALATVDALSAHIAILDETGVILSVNRAWRDFSEANSAAGSNPQVHEGVNYLSVCETASGPDSGEAAVMVTGIRAVMSGWQKEFSLEYACHSPDEKRWFNARVTRFSDEGAARIVVAHENITKRKLAEQFLQISEERYHELFNSMIDGFALHEIICDENGKPSDYRFLEVNPAFERLIGLQFEKFIGKTVLEVMPNTESYWIDVYGNVALTGRSTFYENYSKEVDRYFEVSVYCPRPGQFAVIMVDITERKRAEDSIHKRVTELEMLYQSGLALSQLLNPKEIGEKILELLEEKLNWHHTRIRLYHPQDDSLELLDFNQPGLRGEVERREVVERFQTLITHSDQGMSGWVIQHGLTLRSGDVNGDPRYVEAYPGICSGLYVPMKLGERIIGVISIEDRQPDAFSEADERLIVTLANQAASAFENARLFEETRQRVMELETLNRISLVLRAISKQNEMLSIVLDEALAILNTSHGSIELHNKTTDRLNKTIMRGWMAQMAEPSQKISEGIAGKVFTSGEIYISHEFASDPETCADARSQIPSGWGGVCLPIRTTQQTLGVMTVSMPSEHELNKDEIRLLSILSEMTGAALQRMQLYEQTVRRLEQLNALRAVDQAISSSRDMRLTLNILLTHTISQLGVDAADVLLLHPGSNLLELAAGRGFHTLLLESINLSNSIARRAIMEYQKIMALDFETARLHENPQLGKLWKQEGFVCYWCVPLIVKGEVKGVLEVYRRTAFTPDAEWLEFLESLAGQAAITIDNTQLFENLQRANLDLSLAYDATIEGWSRALDLRDHETEGHTLRVTDLTVKLARAMRISESQLTAIRRGALLHDIGKMGVPDSILLKEGDLTDEEWMQMRKHPQLAYDMLAPIAYLNDALNIPYCHHEKWDGTGYPQGLKGDRIPLVARIFAVVDVWDALTNNRTYRRKWTKQKARQYIKDQSGKHFDPQVVDFFLKNIS